ncbi:hypothetical protein JOB18_049185 [Solea senegalensis]|uniref:Uncharacterized protein n=1 Tax=Solea senegalensis TaxID=28829 RepID=A0AAV6R335_SOLSE|nr:hypothetical protein JOB18_049185 [Solea senegalensis]
MTQKHCRKAVIQVQLEVSHHTRSRGLNSRLCSSMRHMTRVSECGRCVMEKALEALMFADGAGWRWIFTARWSNDERIRLQMVDISRRQLAGGKAVDCADKSDSSIRTRWQALCSASKDGVCGVLNMQGGERQVEVAAWLHSTESKSFPVAECSFAGVYRLASSPRWYEASTFV